jgi:glycosyltransferase involved in cell wall biosynthesis
MLHSSGIGTYIRNLVPQIISSYSDVKFNLLGNISELRYVPWANSANVSLIDCNSPVYSITEQLKVPIEIPSCDIFWSPHYNIPLAPIRAKKRLLTIHDVFHLAFIDQLPFKQRIYARLVLNSAVKISDIIVTVSNFSKSEIVKHTKTGGEKITVIHNGIDTEKFRELDDAALIPVKKKCNLPDKFILFVGNVKPHKNLKRLLGAYEILIKKGITDYYLVIAGKKEGFITGDSEVFRILNNNPILREKVLFTGYMDNSDLPAVYTLASLLIFPSLYEGFGLPPLEAMACGCLTVVSNAASLPEVCGEAAYYIDPYNIENIAGGMERILTDNTLRHDLINKGFKRAGLFSWGESSMEHQKILDEILRS